MHSTSKATRFLIWRWLMRYNEKMDTPSKSPPPKPPVLTPAGAAPNGKTRGKDGTATPSKSLKVKLRGKDGAPLRAGELQQGFYELGRKLADFGDVRFKWATIYLTAIDENGQEIRLDKSGEWTLHPYVSMADEYGL